VPFFDVFSSTKKDVRHRRQMSKKKRAMRRVPTPIGGKCPVTTLPPPVVSCGAIEMRIMKYLVKTAGERFNVHHFSRTFHVERSTVYEALKRLIKKGFVDKPYEYNHILTDAGRSFLGGVVPHRVGSREGDAFSQVRDHKFEFQVPVIAFPKDWRVGMVQYFGEEIQTSVQMFSKNNPIVKVRYPDDVSVLVTTDKVVIRPQNIFVNDHTAAMWIAVSRVYATIALLEKKGFSLVREDGVLPLLQTDGHYAEVNSELAKFFDKHFKGFHVKGADGEFWVDHSNGKLEDEVDFEKGRGLVEKFMVDLIDGKVDLKALRDDVELLKEVHKYLTSEMLMILQIRAGDSRKDPKSDDVPKDGRPPSYIG